MLRKLILVFLLCLLGSESAFALPIFARRYQTSCTTCHTLIPKLNPFGIAFRNNGYRIPLNDEKYVRSIDVSLGAPAWKKLWPKAVWPGAIQGIPPIAVRAAMDADIRPSQPARLNFDFPNNLSVYAAGPAGDTFSYFGQLFMLGATNQLFLDRAYAQFRLSPDKPGANWLNLKLGRIDSRAEPFSTTYRKATIQGFNVSEYRVVSDGFALRDHDAGVEVWGAATGPDDRGGLEYGAGITQGTAGRPENNNYKDQYWGVSYKVGGLGVVGSRNDQAAFTSQNNYSERSITLGTFGYRGKRPATYNGILSEDQSTRTGLKLDVYLEHLNVFGAAVSGRDNFRTAAGTRVKTSAWFAEADYMALPWVMPVVCYEKTSFSDGRRPMHEIIANVNLSLRANVRVVPEGHFYSGQPKGAGFSTPVVSNDGIIRLEFLF